MSPVRGLGALGGNGGDGESHFMSHLVSRSPVAPLKVNPFAETPVKVSGTCTCSLRFKFPVPVMPGVPSENEGDEIVQLPMENDGDAVIAVSLAVSRPTKFSVPTTGYETEPLR